MRDIKRNYKHSYRLNKKRKYTYFKKGNTYALKRWSSFSDTCAESDSIPGPSDEYSHIPTEAEDVTSSLRRLHTSVAQDVLHASGLKSGPTVPFKLRPSTSTSTVENTNFSSKVSDSTSVRNENAIVNLQMLENAFNSLNGHNCDNAILKLSVLDRKGLCITLQLKCQNCNFVSHELPLFHSVKKQGQTTGILNNCLVLPVLGSKLGISDVQLMLACLNIQAPDKRGLQRKFNSLTDEVEKINTLQLEKNQNYVKQVENLAGRTDGTHLEYDVSYTSRPQAGGITATQCFAPTVEKTTLKQLPVDIQIGNKLCPLKLCNHLSRKCKKNYSSDHTINEAETSFLKATINNIESKNILNVQSITTDGSQSLEKATRTLNSNRQKHINHYKCFIHNMRNFHKHLRAANIKAPPGKNRKEYTRILASRL